MNLGENVRRLRTDKGFSQQRLAELSGVSQSTIAAIEKNKQDKTSTKNLTLLAGALNVSEGELSGFEAVNSTEIPFQYLGLARMAQAYQLNDNQVKFVSSVITDLFLLQVDRLELSDTNQGSHTDVQSV